MSNAPYYGFGAVGPTGGTGSTLDNIPTNIIDQDDIAVALDSNLLYFYRADLTSAAVENSPFVIQPDDEIGNKRGILISQEQYNSNLIQLLEHYIQTSKIKANPGSNIEIEASDGSKIIIDTDGNVTFPSYAICDLDPTENNHLTNKLYVDLAIDQKETNLQGYLNTNFQSYVDSEIITKETEIQSYVDFEIESYVDGEIITKETELKQYVDNQIQDIYPMVTETISSGTLDGESYYADVVHNKNESSVLVRCGIDDELINPEKVEVINNNTTRIGMPTNSYDVVVNIM